MKLTRRGTRAFAIIAVAGMPFLAVAGGSASAGVAPAHPASQAPRVAASNHGVPKILAPKLLHEPGAFQLAAVTCVTVAHCVAVGQAEGTVTGGVLVPITNGVLGHPVYADDALSAFSAVSCVTATKCVMVGATTQANVQGDAGVWLYTQGEITQLTLTVPTNVMSTFNGVDCTSATTCVVVGSATHDVDSNPHAPVAMFGTVSLTVDPSANATDNQTAGSANAVACPNSHTCYVAGSSVAGAAEELRIHGAAITGRNQSGVSRLQGIACVTINSCDAAEVLDTPDSSTGHQGWVEHLNSTLKGTPHHVAGATQLDGISVINSGYYLSVGYSSESTWTADLVSAAGTPRPLLDLDLEGFAEGVACPIQTECIAVGRASDPDPTQPGGSSGTDGAVAILHLRTVSTAPRITVRSAARTSETVRIGPPSNNGGAAITSYRLAVARCRPHHTVCHLEFVKAVHVVPSRLTVKVTGLLAKTKYYFTATATNSIGSSAVSTRVEHPTA